MKKYKAGIAAILLVSGAGYSQDNTEQHILSQYKVTKIKTSFVSQVERFPSIDTWSLGGPSTGYPVRSGEHIDYAFADNGPEWINSLGLNAGLSLMRTNGSELGFDPNKEFSIGINVLSRYRNDTYSRRSILNDSSLYTYNYSGVMKDWEISLSAEKIYRKRDKDEDYCIFSGYIGYGMNIGTNTRGHSHIYTHQVSYENMNIVSEKSKVTAGEKGLPGFVSRIYVPLGIEISIKRFEFSINGNVGAGFQREIGGYSYFTLPTASLSLGAAWKIGTSG